MIKYRLLVLILLIISQFMVFGDPNIEDTTIDYSINWKDQQLEIVIKSIFSDITKPLPSIKFSTEMSIEKRLNYILLNGIEQLTIDSRTKGEDFIKTHPSVIEHIFSPFVLDYTYKD